MGFSSVTIQPEQNEPRNWTMVSPQDLAIIRNMLAAFSARHFGVDRG
jgi:hypothetical protein